MSGGILTASLDLIFPPICILCRTRLFAAERPVQVCTSCQDLLTPNRPPHCAQCPRPLPDPDHRLCPACRRAALGFDRAWSACLYENALPHLLHLFKYSEKTSLRRLFGERMRRYLEDYQLPLRDADCVIPIPLHPTRLRERGYNQAELLSRPLASRLGCPHETRFMRRRRHTPNQARLKRNERWTNIDGAFTMKQPLPETCKNIVLIDDLLTTGATASAAATTLKRAGAERVYVFTLAMAL